MFKNTHMDKGLVDKMLENRNLPGEEFDQVLKELEKT